MALVLTSGPATEPVTVGEAKAHLRIDGTTEDTLIASLVLTSRLHVEAALGLALISQGWRLELDSWLGASALEIPIRPLLGVTAIRVLDRDGTATTLAPSSYLVDVISTPPRVVPLNAGWPSPGRQVGGIQIDVTAGFGATAADVPAPLRHAILLLVAHWYEHRDPIAIGSAETRVPAIVSELLQPYRIARL